MWVLRTYTAWLEFVRELLNAPSREFPRWQIQMRLAGTLGTTVSWNWEDADGTYGFELSQSVEGWPTAEDFAVWDAGARNLHPLLHWYGFTGDPRPMSIGRVPRSILPPGAMEVTCELMARVGFEQQLSIPCHVNAGHRAFVAARSGDDFSDEDLELARLVQPLVALLWLQSSALDRCPELTETYGLTGRELAVLQLLADALTADAIARRLGISRRTVHTHLGHIYRKLDVRDRMRAVLVGQAAGLISSDTQRAPDRSPVRGLRVG
jgi:DNA-binding CsgD family transcriptional regulator